MTLIQKIKCYLTMHSFELKQFEDTQTTYDNYGYFYICRRSYNRYVCKYCREEKPE